jgi:hypothetical protein
MIPVMHFNESLSKSTTELARSVMLCAIIVGYICELAFNEINL